MKLESLKCIQDDNQNHFLVYHCLCPADNHIIYLSLKQTYPIKLSCVKIEIQLQMRHMSSHRNRIYCWACVQVNKSSRRLTRLIEIVLWEDTSYHTHRQEFNKVLGTIKSANAGNTAATHGPKGIHMRHRWRQLLFKATTHK